FLVICLAYKCLHIIMSFPVFFFLSLILCCFPDLFYRSFCVVFLIFSTANFVLFFSSFLPLILCCFPHLFYRLFCVVFLIFSTAHFVLFF
ncbi:predicted protein, partial [Nematostella vectensis]